MPPKSFFPEKKDLSPGLDLRRNLITVPSCKRHNTEKSKDDEYLLFVIVSNYETNPVAQHHFATKIMRGIRRRSSILAFMKNGQQVIVNGQLTWMYNIDKDRLDDAMSLISKAIYYHHYGRRWFGKIKIIAPPLYRVRTMGSPADSQKLAAIESSARDLFLDKPKYGENPGVFYYQSFLHEGVNEVIIRLVFFEFFSSLALRKSALGKFPSKARDA